MKIEIQTPLATSGRCYERGQVVEWNDTDAERLIKAGYANPVAVQPPVQNSPKGR